jgi:osmotically-inducible protein OsmY
MINLKPLRGWEKYTLWFPLLFGLTIILMGCEERGRQPRIGTPNPSIHKLERLNASMRDSDLENAVRAKLENDPQLKSADLRVNADAVRNEVTLSGTVRTHAARKKAIELAKSTKPGVAVNDKIDVKPAA